MSEDPSSRSVEPRAPTYEELLARVGRLERQQQSLEQANQEKFQALVDGSPEATFVQTNGRFACVNVAAGRLFGAKSVQELLGQPVLERIHPDHRARAQAQMQQLSEHRQPVPAHEMECFRLDGTSLLVDLSAVPWTHENQSGALVFMHDISERRRSERINASRLHLVQFSLAHTFNELLDETLNEAERLTGSLIGFCHFVDEDQNTLTLQSWSSRTKAEFCKATGEGAHYPVEKAGVWVDCVHQGKPVVHNDYASLPHRKGMPEGHAQVIRELVVPVFRDGKIRAIIGVGNKPTDYTQADVEAASLLADLAWDTAERSLALEALREADRRKNEFIAVLSHELRNPLAPIRNSLMVLERAPWGGEQNCKAQVVIERQVTQLTRLIDDLLDVTRISRGNIQLRLERVDLGEIVSRAVDDLRAEFEARGVGLNCQIAAQSWVNADVTRVAQVVGNLLGNAAKFTPRGGQVEVALEREGAQVVLRTRDTGVGIAPELLKDLFQPFAQAHQGLARSYGGLGLGLHLVKGLVELHGGGVKVASDGLGQGAEFTVRLPLAEAAGQAAPVAGAGPCRGRRVLVIEDNLDAADSLKEALALNGHTVQVAYDGPSGLALAREFHPELVFCDIGLPGMDGYQVAQAFRAEECLRGSVLVALTGYALPEDKLRAEEAGFAHHLAKPPTLKALQAVLSAAS